MPSTAAPIAAQGTLSDHLEAAVAIDAESHAIEAQREAARARSAFSDSLVPGSFAASGSFRADTRGPGMAREAQVDLAAPLWLPGQRSAVASTVVRDVASADERLRLRRLELANLLREAWWEVALRRAETRVQRDRLATAGDILGDVRRRLNLGEVAEPDLLLAQNERVAAELALAQARAAEQEAELAYRALTGGAAPGQGVEGLAEPRAAAGLHPALRAASAAVAAAEAQVRLVAATPIDNPELGGYVMRQEGTVTEQGTSFGLRLRVPLPSAARNRPREAAARSELTSATSRLVQTRRLTDAAVQRAEVALRAAEETESIARRRLAIARQQLASGNRAFQAGEMTLFDLVRVRQIAIDAASAAARSEVDVGLGRARLNQAFGAEPVALRGPSRGSGR
ncbi:TolC family protein [Roseomonas sp. KE2513]|uniref:TolC family protein n=1 Tax=Roseomonas sp. KE2513 TaxID=2479202 RepID=UPI0018E03CFB|nr:TolC family protein [Roseomonas sp. KE2513]